MKTETATFARGCFWQPDYIFSKVSGIVNTKVGYTGCNKNCKNPTYEQVCSDSSGCAEAIQLEFNASIISYPQLLDIFWTHHDPTQMNKQGPDIGSQYRSAIFYHNEEQKTQALKSKEKNSKLLLDKKLKIVTEITQATTFYNAEDYHQKYLDKSGRACHVPRNVFR